MIPKRLFLRSLLWRRVVWTVVSTGKWSTHVAGRDVFLELGDFPDEPLFRIRVDSTEAWINDPPRKWEIPRST